ncbi:MAG: VOC family protein [Dehalococcoidales bacterium]|nr:VOC family protein [Dehalococcoidales bacterium]
MKIEKIDHIHLFVKNLESAVPVLEDVFGKDFVQFQSGTILDVSDRFGVKVAHHRLGMEVIQVTDASKQDPAQLPKGGKQEGIFAIDIKVTNIDEAIAELKAKGLKMVSRSQVGQMKEAMFVSPKIPMQIELSEFPGNDISAASGM